MSSQTSITAIRKVQIRLTGDAGNSFEGIACQYGVEDSYGTTFVAECFTKGGLDAKPYALLWLHDPARPIGTFTAVERADGLYIVGRWDETTAGQEARAAALSGSATDLSVGFTWYTDGSDTKMIEVARLHEVSQVASRFGAVPGSTLTAVRAAWAEDAQRGMVVINQAAGETLVEAVAAHVEAEAAVVEADGAEIVEAEATVKKTKRSGCGCEGGCATQGTSAAEEAETADRKVGGPKAVIVDIDDTLIADGALIQPVYDYVVSLDAAVILVTGRSADTRDETVAELEALGVKYDELHMRDFGSFAQSVDYKVYKAGLLLEKYDVVLAIDNDEDTRTAYRALGLDTLNPEDLMGDHSGDNSGDHATDSRAARARRARAYAAYLRTII